MLTQPDGIHVTVHNTSDGDATLNFLGRGDVAPPGDTVTVQDLPPTGLVISCGYDQNRVIVAAGTVEVLDPAGNWRPTNIGCTQLPLTGWEEPPGVGPSPEKAVRWWATNRAESLTTPIAADDEVDLVGYPEAEAPRYVSRRDGQDTNIFRLERVADGWRATPHENCPR